MHTAKRIFCLLLAALLLLGSACAQEAAPQTQWVQLGEGANEMTLVVVFPDGNVKGYHIRSDAATLLEGLLALELIVVEPTEEGLVLTGVDGAFLPEDDPAASWFIAVYDATEDTLVPCREPLEQLLLPGQTYAMGQLLTLAPLPTEAPAL